MPVQLLSIDLEIMQLEYDVELDKHKRSGNLRNEIAEKIAP